MNNTTTRPVSEIDDTELKAIAYNAVKFIAAHKSIINEVKANEDALAFIEEELAKREKDRLALQTAEQTSQQTEDKKKKSLKHKKRKR